MIINSNINSICRNEVLSSNFVKHFVKHWVEITMFCLKNHPFFHKIFFCIPKNKNLTLNYNVLYDKDLFSVTI